VKVIDIKAAKLAVTFKQGELPSIDPARPVFALQLGSHQHRINVVVNARAARKLAVHQGGCVLQGRLVDDHGTLKLLDAGISLFEPKPAEQPQEQPA
jgi:hypothetical protein